jgi:RimJ/RimL family protein N-acetyltransferase
MTEIHIACTSRVVVRTFRPGDAPSLARHGNSHAIWRNLRDRFPHPYTAEAAGAYISGVLERGLPTSLAIEVDGAAAGGVSVRPGVDIERVSAEVGYWLGEAYWGQGIMSAAVAAVSEPAFDWFGLTRLFALPFARNHASSRVLERAGYVRTALIRRSVIKEGEILDEYLYERHRPETGAPTR